MTRTTLRNALAKAVLLTAALAAFASQPSSADEPATYDVVVYGGTSAGVAAAVQVRRMGGSVVVLEPTDRIGGLTTGGLGATDIGNKAAIGGVAREFYQRVLKFYDNPDHWKQERRDAYFQKVRRAPTSDAMWTFEPSAALSIMKDLVRENKIPVLYEQRLDRTAVADSATGVRGVTMDGKRITAITTDSGRTFRGRVFLDATYEGDLLAAAGVSYAVGRESNEMYRETLNGVQTRHAKYHQFLPGVDPYVVAGDPQSGLLPGIDPQGPGKEGSGDRRVQAFCFRMCLTDDADNRIPFAKPAGYDPLQFELLLRNFEAGERGMPWINTPMPNRKTDTNNRTGFSTDFIGQNYAYPEASYGERVEIVARHRAYQKGLMWTLANDSRVPNKIRNEVARWGMCRDEFESGDGWQKQLYVREARRMIGDYVMTQHNCQGRIKTEKPIGLAAYTMDSHHTQRYLDPSGHVRNEGDVEIGGFPPYSIDYGSLTPKASECENLLVPVCLSASHIAFGSIRMEPVFMVLGQSSATAAMIALQDGVAVQQVDYAKLKTRLLADQQILAWSGPRRASAASVDANSLKGIVVDDADAKRSGFDNVSGVVGPFVGDGYRHDGNAGKGDQSATFAADIPKAGLYEVRIAWSPNANRATNVPVTIHHAKGKMILRLNQRQPPNHSPFGTVGVFPFAVGASRVEIGNANTDGHVIIDAVQWLPIAGKQENNK